MLNKIIVIGNFTKDTDLKYLSNGTTIASNSIAVNRKFKNKMGEVKEETCFIDVAFFGRTAEVVNQYLSKGSKILVEGRLKFDQWVSQNGDKRSKHSIIADSMQMLDKKKQDQGRF